MSCIDQLPNVKLVYCDMKNWDSLPEKIQMQIMDMLSIPDEETLYDFLETYSS